MAKKKTENIIDDLQNNPDYVVLNNPLAVPKFVRKISRGKERSLSEVYTPKIFFEIVSRLTPMHLDTEGNDYVKLDFSISEFLTASGAKNSKNFYRHILDCIDLLQTTQVKWEDTEYNYGMSVIPFYKHEKNSGVVEIHVNKELVRTVLAVTQHEHFSFLKKYLFRLDNAQAIKIFPFLLSWRNRGMVEMKLEAFKKKFGYDTEGYKIFSNLEKYVIVPAVNEINEKTELTVSYEKLGDNLDGKRPRITGLRFFIVERKSQKQLPQTTKIVENQTVLMLEKVDDKSYWNEIFRVFRLFEKTLIEDEVRILVTGLSSLGSAESVLEAVLYAEEEQERRRKQGKPLIENFRGFIIAGIPRGMGKGILVEKEAKQKQNAELKARKAQSEQLERWKNEADEWIERYRLAVNEVIRTTATDAEKENVAEILRGSSSIYKDKTVDDFRNKMFIHAFISKFIEVYAPRFEPLKPQFEPQFEALKLKIRAFDPSYRKKLAY
ncbi:MAG: replication initiation protein [Saprospiraceae bacterium]|nr:replication initiation protein [Saprospiraceae bacterium]